MVYNMDVQETVRIMLQNGFHMAVNELGVFKRERLFSEEHRMLYKAGVMYYGEDSITLTTKKEGMVVVWKAPNYCTAALAE
jgi:hypothetical protein